MEASIAPRVVELTRRIAVIRQIIELIDGGATIVAMTLTPGLQPQAPAMREADEPPEEEDDERASTLIPDSEPSALAPDWDLGPGQMTVATEGLTYPPQMMDSIRAQELKLWQDAYDELQKAGVTGAPKPSADKIQPAAAPPPAPREASRAAPRPPSSPPAPEEASEAPPAPKPASAPAKPAAKPAATPTHRGRR